MMRSMTGYGRGESGPRRSKFSVELNSVNRKQSDVVVNLPRDLAELEPRVREAINAKISRGRLNVVVACTRARIERPQSRARYRAGPLVSRRDADVAKGTERAGEITIGTILQAPGVLRCRNRAWTRIKRWPPWSAP